jgi:hypothetical protein
MRNRTKNHPTRAKKRDLRRRKRSLKRKKRKRKSWRIPRRSLRRVSTYFSAVEAVYISIQWWKQRNTVQLLHCGASPGLWIGWEKSRSYVD